MLAFSAAMPGVRAGEGTMRRVREKTKLLRTEDKLCSDSAGHLPSCDRV